MLRLRPGEGIATSPALDESLRARCAEFIQAVRKDERSASFRLPVSKKHMPYYYDIISSPMDLRTLESKLVTGQYATLEEFANGLRQIWLNAFIFNEKGDRTGRKVFEMAQELALESDAHLEALRQSVPLTVGEERIPVMQRLQIELFLLRQNPLALWFREPVSQAEHPEYYERIAQPMDLQTALRLIDTGEWKSPQQVGDGVHFVWMNAQEYNGAESAIGVAAMCCYTVWKSRFEWVVNSAPRQRKPKRPRPETLEEHARLALLDTCKCLPTAILAQIFRDHLRAGAGTEEPEIDLGALEAQDVLQALEACSEHLARAARSEGGVK